MPLRFASRSQKAQSSALRAGAGGQAMLKGRAILPCGDVGRQIVQHLRHTFRSFAIAGIGHALAPTHVFTLANLGHHNDRLGLGAREMVKVPAIGRRSMRTCSEIIL